MAIRIEWDEFEIALLIEACEEVLRKGKPKSEVVKTVSSNLRKRAISKNIAIDDVFRNENGIALQMQKMAYLLTHGEKGMPGASKLYAEVAELREENPKKFEEILKRAKEEIEMTDLSQQNIDKKALFAQWLNEHPIKKYTPSAIIDALDVASRYCVSKKVCKDGFWSMQNKAEFNAVASKLLSFRLFRLKYRSAAAKMDKAIPLYKAFLDSYVASREENTAEFEGEALNEPDSMLSTAAANSDDIIRLAKDYGFTSYRIYDVTTSDAVALLNALMRDDGFAAYNIRQHNRFRAELLCDNSVMDAIIDCFGPDVQTYAGDLQNFRVIEEIAVGKVFFNWIFGFEGKVRIKGPESVKKQYREMLMSAMNLV